MAVSTKFDLLDFSEGSLDNQVTARLAEQLSTHHDRQRDLCTSLEDIADSLPGTANRQACLVISRLIYPTVKAAHVFEEQELFPYLQNRAEPQSALEASLERLRFEHWEDESFAEELSECLRNFAAGDRADLADTLSYMIRGFFEGLKRHMAFEKEHLLPLVQNNLQLRT